MFTLEVMEPSGGVSRPRTRQAALGPALLAIAGLLGAFAFAALAGDPDPATTPIPTNDTRDTTIEQLEAEPALEWSGQDRETLSDGDLEFEQQIADGWVRQGDGQGNTVGWVSSDALGSDAFFYEGRTPVFDEPRGRNVVGYAYNGVGFVDIQTIESGQFDLEAAFDAKYGPGAYATEQAEIERMLEAEAAFFGD